MQHWKSQTGELPGQLLACVEYQEIETCDPIPARHHDKLLHWSFRFPPLFSIFIQVIYNT